MGYLGCRKSASKGYEGHDEAHGELRRLLIHKYYFEELLAARHEVTATKAMAYLPIRSYDAAHAHIDSAFPVAGSSGKQDAFDQSKAAHYADILVHHALCSSKGVITRLDSRK